VAERLASVRGAVNGTRLKLRRLLRRAGVNVDGGERLLRRVLHIPLHFEARDQFDIAGGAVYAGFPVAQRFIAGTKSYPFRLKLVARLRLLVRAPFLLLLRAELALPRDIEFRRGVRDRGGMQRSQNNDRQVNQHFFVLRAAS